MSKANWLSIITSMVLQLCLGLFVYKYLIKWLLPLLYHQLIVQF
ncbi:hypothetical protein H6L66_05730 [Staphylococcus epidermidis]|nr:hypothetical protein [Staphylococcus epidermidis]